MLQDVQVEPKRSPCDDYDHRPSPTQIARAHTHIHTRTHTQAHAHQLQGRQRVHNARAHHRGTVDIASPSATRTLKARGSLSFRADSRPMPWMHAFARHLVAVGSALASSISFFSLLIVDLSSSLFISMSLWLLLLFLIIGGEGATCKSPKAGSGSGARCLWPPLPPAPVHAQQKRHPIDT